MKHLDMNTLEVDEVLTHASNEVRNLRESNEILQHTLDKIDDYFEYMNESKKDRKVVQKILKECTEEFRKLYA